MMFEIINLSISLVALFLAFIAWRNRDIESALELQDELDEIIEDCEKKIEDLEMYQADLHDRLDKVLEPMAKRNRTREQREQKELNSMDNFKKGGLVRGGIYGNNKIVGFGSGQI